MSEVKNKCRAPQDAVSLTLDNFELESGDVSNGQDVTSKPLRSGLPQYLRRFDSSSINSW